MSNVYTYSAITTKLRAMKAKLLKPDDYILLAQSENLKAFINQLNSYPTYSQIFKDSDLLHRSDIEKILAITKYKDFTKIYNFADGKTRKFLKLYFMNYEIALIKRCLRNCLNKKDLNLDLRDFKTFFKQHSNLDFDDLIQAIDKKSFIENLKGTIYYNALSALSDNAKILDYETCMDQLYFHQLWKVQNSLLTKKEQHSIIKCFGTRIDLLNIQWIYRSKRYFNLPKDRVMPLLINHYYKISANQILQLVDAASINEFETIFDTTYYGKQEKLLFDNKPTLEVLLKFMLDKAYKTEAINNPYSIAMVNDYLYAKENEIETLINIIEAIKYTLPYEEIVSDILMQDTRRANT